MSEEFLDNFADGKGIAKEAKKAKEGKKKSVAPKDRERGCEFCPWSEAKGIHKIKKLEEIGGKRIFVWGQNPGEKENSTQTNLVGPAGKLLWKEAARVDLYREDCDIQNVVRCYTTKHDDLDRTIPRDPTKQEIHCCSIYNEEAVARNAGKARVHLVLGTVAAHSLLRGEYRKDQKTFYSKKLDAWVICTWHPAHLLRGAPEAKFEEFSSALKAVVAKSKQGKGQFTYLEKQDYQVVKAVELPQLRKEIAEANTRIAVDIEDDTDPRTGKKVIICVGLSWKRGMARILFLYHPQIKQSDGAVKLKLEFLCELLENKSIGKVLQHGAYDVRRLWEVYRIRLRGYDHDTQYSEYLRFSGRRGFGLETTADIRFREFAGYKAILDPFRNPETGLVSLLTVPPNTIRLYNGADCDLTKRIEKSNDGKVPNKLMRLYIRVATTINRMEETGPWLDEEHQSVLELWIPLQIKRLQKRLAKISGDPNFNPNAVKRCMAPLIYDKLKLGMYLDEKWKEENPRSTGEATLLLLAQFSEVPDLVMRFRKLFKKESTYRLGFKRSADNFGGRVRTKWWLTGAITGRLRSGGDKADKAKKTGIINLQNVHGEDTIENMLVSDRGWRTVYNEWLRRKNKSEQNSRAGA